MTHPNADVVRRMIDAISKQDIETALGMIAPDALYHVAGHGPISGVYKGREQIQALARQQLELTDGTFEVTEIHDVIANDDHVVALLRLRAHKGNQVLDWGRVVVYHVSGEHVTEAWIVDGEQAGLDRFLRG